MIVGLLFSQVVGESLFYVSLFDFVKFDGVVTGDEFFLSVHLLLKFIDLILELFNKIFDISHIFLLDIFKFFLVNFL